MRVQNPDQYASTLLNITMPNERYTPEKIRSMYGRSEIDLKFPTPIPVNITYQTAFVDDAGKLQMRKDVYGRDAVMHRLAQERRRQGSGDAGRACAAELFAPERRVARRCQLRQRQQLLVRTIVLRAAVRWPVDDDAAGAGRPTAATVSSSGGSSPAV